MKTETQTSDSVHLIPSGNQAATVSTPRMDPAIKARWVAALRSGEYEQGTSYLRKDGGFCCLGVLCDMYAQETGCDWQHDGDAMRLTLEVAGTFYPPPVVREWAHFHEDTQPVEIGGARVPLTLHNDGVDVPRRTFAEIADAIEAQL